MFASVSPLVVEETTFSLDLVAALAQNRALAARFPGYCSPEICAHVLERMSDMVGEGYADEPTFKKMIGGAVYDAASDPRLIAYYLESAAYWQDQCRRTLSPYLNPADRLRYELDSIWPKGCRIEQFRGRDSFFGLIRAFDLNAEARPHQDMTHWDIPNVPEAQNMMTQLSCVIYFSCSNQGGELELWDRGYTNVEDYERSKVPGDYSIDRKHIGEPVAVLRPQVGEMIVFNARNLHAVRRNESGERRCTQSMFISFRGIDTYLGLFS
ncbi:hypothetical protein DBR17_14525 [Sphingomonas sp. HMWF008]|nr:hypothetical protein DBR17_14525 [Sphingomonas sp. HMWF008]